MSRRSSHSSAHPAEALPEGMTPPLRYAQSTDNEEIVINIDHLDYSDNTVPGDNFGVGGHTNYQDYGRDVPPYFIQQPRARSFGDEQRAFASGFRRRAHSDSAPFSATTSLASEYTADNTFALADDFSDSSELPRISIPNQTSQWAPRGHLHPIQTSSLSPLSLSPHSPFPVAEWRSNASDASSIRSSPSPSPSIGILSPLPPLPPAPPFLSPDHPSYLGIYSGGSPTLHPHSRSNSRTRAHEVDSRDGEGAVVGGWSAYDHHQPPAGSSANGMDHRIGSLKLEDDFSLGPSLISPNPVWHYGSAASHQAQGAAFQTQTDVAWHTGERQVHDQHVNTSFLLHPGSYHLSTASPSLSSLDASYPFPASHTSSSTASPLLLQNHSPSLPHEGGLGGSGFGRSASHDHAFGPPPSPLILLRGDHGQQLHGHSYASASGPSTAGADDDLTTWPPRGASANQGGDDPPFLNSFTSFKFESISADNVLSESLGHQSAQEGNDQQPPSDFRARVGTDATDRAAKTRRKDPENGGKFKCPHCPRDFTAKHNLKNHINSHNSLKPYGCPKCHEHFGTSHVMKRHARKCQTHQSFRRKRTS